MADFEKRNDGGVPIGIEVVGFDGRTLGYVREAHEHYLLVGTDSPHKDLEVPVQSILGIEDGSSACTSLAHPHRQSTTKNLSTAWTRNNGASK